MAEQAYFDTEVGYKYYWKDDKLHIRRINAGDFYEDPPPTPLTDTNPKTAHGKAKPPMQYVPPVALLELGLVMEHGASKYGLMNWRKDPISASTFYDALMRHAFQYWDGNDRDLESKRKHLAHIMACCTILLDAEASGSLIDDRPKSGSTESYIILNTRTFDAD